MSRQNPKFKPGDYVQLISKRSKFKGAVCRFIDYTNGKYDDICIVTVGNDHVLYVKEKSIIPMDSKVVKTHYMESCRKYDSYNAILCECDESVY